MHKHASKHSYIVKTGNQICYKIINEIILIKDVTQNVHINTAIKFYASIEYMSLKIS